MNREKIDVCTSPRLKKKADMLKYTKKLSAIRQEAYLDELGKIASGKREEKKPAAAVAAGLQKWGPLALVGGTTGLWKGTMEDIIARRLEKKLEGWKPPSKGVQEIKAALPRGLGRGITGALSVVTIGLAMQHLMSKKKGGGSTEGVASL